MKKNILLVNPWIYDFAAYDLWMFPLGLLNIAARLKNEKIKLYFLNCLDRFEPELLISGFNLPKASFYNTGHFFKQKIPKPDILNAVPRKFFRYGIPAEATAKKLKGLSPDLILVTSGMTYWYLGVKEIIVLLRKYFPSCPVVLGGIYATLLIAAETLDITKVFSLDKDFSIYRILGKKHLENLIK